MSTPNFARNENASKIFAVLLGYDEKYCECTECNTKFFEWEEGYTTKEEDKCIECDEVTEFNHDEEYVYPDDFRYDDLIDNITYEFKKYDVYYPDYDINDHSNSYNSKAIGVLRDSKYYGDIEVCIEVIPIITSAYYEGATLDYLIRYDGDEYDDIDDYLDDVFEYNSDMNKGMQTIQKENAKAWLENELEMMSAIVEKVFDMYTEVKLQCDGIFSNGEAIYSKVN